MELSDGERLILAMLCEIYAKLKISGEIDPKIVRSALNDGERWRLVRQYPALFREYEDQKEHVEELVQILDMWCLIEASYESLSEQDKAGIRTKAPHLVRDIKFFGFDANREAEHLSTSHQLIKDIGRFARFKGRDLDARRPTIEIYRRMYSAFEPLRGSLRGCSLNVPQIIEILTA
ncbi:YfbU family protein [Inquilinus limosus]|uniref:YfbU family protein n=1 Tax=Inquilinus limosus TaxID=171674 RepID=UPI003F1730EE